MSVNSKSYPRYLEEKVRQHELRRAALNGRNILHGLTPTASSIQLISNDYLRLAGHPEVRYAQKKVLENEDDLVLMSSAFMHGDNPQIFFEERMATFLDAEETVLCQSGYSANVGLIQAVLEDTDTPVYIDMMAHMSLWDGAKFSGAKIQPFRHNNVDQLMYLINKNGPGLVIVDSIYSTNGSVCPLQELVDAAYDKGCVLLVDESHSLGTHGPYGRGMVVQYGLQNKVMFRTASLAKAFAGRAGLVTCPTGFGDYFKCTSKPSIFSSALLPYEIAGLDMTLNLILESDYKREKLRKNASFLRQSLEGLGYNTDHSASQIIALESGTEWQTMILKDALENRGVFGSVFLAPATAKNRALVRFSVNADLTDAQLVKIIQVCEEIREEVDFLQWRSTRKRKVPRAEAVLV
ncbi:alpha-hydroxyketone-type quorum-sensing autoinducer synthase [Marinomonas mediterranea]|uniref:alpha-hydroxyketone-type quorum-sensing autoinducer synthase n=1 Tax=Marinomonas mediterranea TaxID=119864 RepID=UPI00234A0466|nr:alpha-hydroxyketone-type quorum-sensing autoinducer synthase [Marinomonas mediterranea]WCN10858.1 quorum-sensing autoinducer synthase [Marinomonas mediterranea]